MHKNKKIRIFIGLNLPNSVKENIFKIQHFLSNNTPNKMESIRAKTRGCYGQNTEQPENIRGSRAAVLNQKCIKWVKKNNLHITLKFLGQIKEKKIQDISTVIKPIADKTSEFTICLSKIGAFPNFKHPKIIWIGAEKKYKQMFSLHQEIEKELHKLGLKKDKRNFHLHITIGRVKKQKQKLIRLLKTAKYPNQTINIKNIVLYKSILTPQGPIYSIINQYTLSNPDYS